MKTGAIVKIQPVICLFSLACSRSLSLFLFASLAASLVHHIHIMFSSSSSFILFSLLIVHIIVNNTFNIYKIKTYYI